jgi:hypothetical protein
MVRTGREQTFGVFVCAVALVPFTMYLVGSGLPVWLRLPTEYPQAFRTTGFYAAVVWSVFGAFVVWGQYSCGRFPRVWANYGRLFYTWACVFCLLHIAIAFNDRHVWSHRRAYEHVESTSGFGPGIYVNYLFATLWLVDVLWAWVALEHYLRRPRWLSWSLLVFMAFIVFNAAVVFGMGDRRIVSGVLFLLPFYAIWATRPWAVPREKTNEPGRGPGSGDASQSAAGHSPT